MCQQVGNTQELFPVLYGLSRLFKKRGKLRRARDLGEQLLLLAQRQGDAALLLRSHYVLGDTLLWLGEFPAARAHLEQGIAVYNPQQHDPHDLLYEADPWLGCLGALAVTLTLTLTLTLAPTPSNALAPLLLVMLKQVAGQMATSTIKDALLASLSGMGCKGIVLSRAIAAFDLRSVSGALSGGMPKMPF